MNCWSSGKISFRPNFRTWGVHLFFRALLLHYWGKIDFAIRMLGMLVTLLFPLFILAGWTFGFFGFARIFTFPSRLNFYSTWKLLRFGFFPAIIVSFSRYIPTWWTFISGSFFWLTRSYFFPLDPLNVNSFTFLKRRIWFLLRSTLELRLWAKLICWYFATDWALYFWSY